ncbi:MAG TPA: hypothetical protein VFV94_12320 [Polyangiaceae bacterium]|jgi:hypothetical protein|nr:hypothetical protein [Polyangiaceae bacterium]
MASKFAQFLNDNKIDPRRLTVVSKRIERLQPEDRKLKFEKSRSKKGDAPAAAAAEGEKKAPAKPRSGRPVTPRLVAAATEGKPVAGAAKTRLLRAVNRILEQKKKPAVDLRSVF